MTKLHHDSYLSLCIPSLHLWKARKYLNRVARNISNKRYLYHVEKINCWGKAEMPWWESPCLLLIWLLNPKFSLPSPCRMWNHWGTSPSLLSTEKSREGAHSSGHGFGLRGDSVALGWHAQLIPSQRKAFCVEKSPVQTQRLGAILWVLNHTLVLLLFIYFFFSVAIKFPLNGRGKCYVQNWDRAQSQG